MEKRLLEHFYMPDCFNSTQEFHQYQNQFILVFKLNETLISKSYSTLSALLNVNEQNFKRRRFVACVGRNSRQVLADSDCDPSTRPPTEDYCPLPANFAQSIPRLQFRFCEQPASTTSTYHEVFNEIGKQTGEHHLLTSQSSPSNSISTDTIVWRVGTWSRCYCDNSRKAYIARRLVLCVRQFPITNYEPGKQNWQHISDQYCLQARLAKPAEAKPCNPGGDYLVGSECGTPDLYPSYELTNLSTMHTGDQSVPYEQSTLPTTSVNSQPISTFILPLKPTVPLLSTATLDQSSSSYEQSHYIVSTPTYDPSSNQIFDYWEWTEWSKCSVPCGNGTQYRSPLCSNGKHCNPLRKPRPEFQSCFRFCDYFQWRHTEWSECSVTCGQGVQTRNVECYDWTGTSVSQRFCEPDRKPAAKKKCQEKDCKLKWSTEPWSEVHIENSLRLISIKHFSLPFLCFVYPVFFCFSFFVFPPIPSNQPTTLTLFAFVSLVASCLPFLSAAVFVLS